MMNFSNILNESLENMMNGIKQLKPINHEETVKVVPQANSNRFEIHHKGKLILIAMDKLTADKVANFLKTNG